MSFLYDAVLPGTTTAFAEAGGPARDVQRTLRPSRSHAGLVASLVKLIRDPAGTLGGTIGSAIGGNDDSSKNNPSAVEVERKQVLYLRLRNAESYEEWKAAATALDTLEGNDAWKLDDNSHEYDVTLVAARLEQLDEARLSCDVRKMLFLIRTSLTRGLGGMGDLRLYKHSHIGTKALIERYISSAQKTLTALLEVSAKQGPNCPVEPRQLVEQLLLARQSFGRSALLLSGGGTFGMNHIGVVKSLWDARLLPRIISGTSAGSIVCAVLCSKTDAEIPVILEEFCYGDLAVFEKEGEEEGLLKKAARFLKYGALFDISHLMNVMRKMLGDITFQESYNRTRRILNITVSSASLYELPRLLNYVTAPNVMIWSAVCASCSVPFVFSAASLLAKDPKTGKEIPWDQTANIGWIDGSVDNDLPMTRLAEMFNVNHFIVSQVNPHVVPFLAREEEIVAAEAQQNLAFPANPSWIHNMANLAKGEALHRLHMLSEMGVFPNYLTKARSILNQRYSGDITIFPSISYTHFPKVLSNPTTEYMLQCCLTGERATWPALSRIQNHLAIELALDETIRKLRARVVFSPSQVDLRLNKLDRPVSHGNDRRKRVSQRSNRPKRATDPSTPLLSSPSRRTNHPLVRLPSHVVRPYLPRQHLRKHTTSVDHSLARDSIVEAFSSSTNPEGTSDDEISVDSNTSPSPPISRSSSPLSSNRRLFPFASQPTTPSSATPRRSGSLISLNMTFNQRSETSPSSPQLARDRHFPPAGAPQAAPVRPRLSNTVGKAVRPAADGFANFRTGISPEVQKVPPVATFNTHSILAAQGGSLHSPGFSGPALESVGGAGKASTRVSMNTKVPPSVHRASGKDNKQGGYFDLAMDISGTET